MHALVPSSALRYGRSHVGGAHAEAGFDSWNPLRIELITHLLEVAKMGACCTGGKKYPDRVVRICDVELHGQTVPEGSVMMMLIGAANRDRRQFEPDGDVFDINREQRAHLGFSVGAHYCLGSSLARLEGRVALEEVLKRFPTWEVDLAGAVFSTTSTIRGWDSMPASIP